MSQAVIAIRQDIGRGPDELSADVFSAALEQLGQQDEILLRINSNGGAIFEASAIVTAMLASPARWTALIEGVAASAAGVIAIAADRLLVHEHSFLMVHSAQSGSWGNRFDKQKEIEILRSIDEMIAGIFARRAGGDVQDWLNSMREESWFSGRELVDLGLASMISDERPALSATATARLQQKVRAREYCTDEFVNRLVARRKSVTPISFPTDPASRLDRIAELERDQC